jgi:hypothetical protein
MIIDTLVVHSDSKHGTLAWEQFSARSNNHTSRQYKPKIDLFVCSLLFSFFYVQNELKIRRSVFPLLILFAASLSFIMITCNAHSACQLSSQGFQR